MNSRTFYLVTCLDVYMNKLIASYFKMCIKYWQTNILKKVLLLALTCLKSINKVWNWDVKLVKGKVSCKMNNAEAHLPVTETQVFGLMVHV